MADEGTLGLARAPRERGDDEPDKEELQRRMEEARESISQTVMEIKETVTNQYYSVKETVSDALDWRHHFRQHPIAFTVGALSAGALIGYSIGGTFKDEGSDRSEQAPSEEYDDPNRHSAFHGHSYAAQPIVDGVSGDERATDSEQGAVGTSQGGSYSFSASQSEDEASQKPSLFERFKGTTAYDRLQTEVSTLGDRFIDELATTAHTVVLPMLFKKIKELIGVDLSDKQKQHQSDQGEKGGTSTAAATEAKASSEPAVGAASAAAGRSASSYGTSENRGYGTQSSAADSVLDLDR